MRDRIHEMSILLLCQFCVFVKSFPFSAATTPSLNIGSLHQPPVAAIPPLDLSRNLTLPPSPAATTHRNASNDPLPPNYLIPDTNPLIILQINPGRHHPIDPLTLTYIIVHGLDSLVQDTIRSRGDGPIPDQGMVFSSNGATVAVQSHRPGARGLTHGTMAALLRGVWEMAALFGACELDVAVYVGRQDGAHYQGHLAVYLTVGSGETG